MQTLLVLYKWQIALIVSLVVIVWPYVLSVANWMSMNASARELVTQTFIAVIGLLFITFIAFTIWQDQRPGKRAVK